MRARVLCVYVYDVLLREGYVGTHAYTLVYVHSISHACTNVRILPECMYARGLYV